MADEVSTPTRRRKRPPHTSDGTMTLIEHLYELRARLFKAVLVIIAGALVGIFVLYDPVLHILQHPYCSLPAQHRLQAGNDTSCKLLFFNPLDGFLIRIKVGAVVGIVISSPVWLYQLWAFITPGLKKNERRISMIFVGCSTLLFAGGAALAYFTLSKGLHLLISSAGSGTVAALSITGYLSFVTTMLFVFGISFEFPLLISMLNLVGVLSFQRLMKWQRAIIFLVFAFAAVATPSQDPFTMCALAVPMCLLFELAVLIAWRHDKRKAKRQAIENFHDVPDDEASPLDTSPTPIDDPESVDERPR